MSESIERKLTCHIAIGSEPRFPKSSCVVVIDVIRAFTVAQILFERGAKEIFLAADKNSARAMREIKRGAILAGEEGGLPIHGFELDNSPANVSDAWVDGRSVVQTTTNGVVAARHALKFCPTVYAACFRNAESTVAAVRRHCDSHEQKVTVTIIASSARGDEDLACAEYMQKILLQEEPEPEPFITRVINSEHARKFLDKENSGFFIDDLAYCLLPRKTNFAMLGELTDFGPKLRKESICEILS